MKLLKATILNDLFKLKGNTATFTPQMAAGYSAE
jgi:hypothetical protein